MSNVSSKLERDSLENMGAVMSGLKSVSPIRPHPGAPDTQPGVSIAGMVAGTEKKDRTPIFLLSVCQDQWRGEVTVLFIQFCTRLYGSDSEVCGNVP